MKFCQVESVMQLEEIAAEYLRDASAHDEAVAIAQMAEAA
jgi:hypothetical protein